MQEGKSVEQRVHSLLSIGMTESEVVRLLTDAGIQFGETIKPTASGDYFTIHVPLRTSRGILETAEYVVTGSGRFTGSKAYVVVTLDADSIVTAIE